MLGKINALLMHNPPSVGGSPFLGRINAPYSSEDFFVGEGLSVRPIHGNSLSYVHEIFIFLPSVDGTDPAKDVFDKLVNGVNDSSSPGTTPERNESE